MTFINERSLTNVSNLNSLKNSFNFYNWLVFTWICLRGFNLNSENESRISTLKIVIELDA